MLLSKLLTLSRCLLGAGLVAALAACSPSVEDAATATVVNVTGTLMADKPVAGLRYEIEARGEWFPVNNTGGKRWSSMDVARQSRGIAVATDGAPNGSLWSINFNSTSGWAAVPNTVSPGGWASVAVDNKGLVGLAAEKNGALWRFNGLAWSRAAETAGKNWCCVAVSSSGSLLMAAETNGDIWYLDSVAGQFVKIPAERADPNIYAIGINETGFNSEPLVYLYGTDTSFGVVQIPGQKLYLQGSSLLRKTPGRNCAYAGGRLILCSTPRIGVGLINTDLDAGSTEGAIKFTVEGNSHDGALLAGRQGIYGFVRDEEASDRFYIYYYDAVELPTSAPINSIVSAVAMTHDGSIQLAAESNGPIWQRFNPPALFTNDRGEFSCISGRKVSFYLGNKKLGTANCARQINVMQLVASNESDHKGVQIAQLLKTVSQPAVTSTISIPRATFTSAFDVSVDLNTTDTAAFTASATAVATRAGMASPAVPDAASVPGLIDAALVAKAGVTFANDLCSLNPCRGGARIANSTGQSGTATLGGLVRGLGVGELAILKLQWTVPSSTATQSISMVISGAGSGDGTYTWALSPTNGVNYAVSVTSAPAACVLSRTNVAYNGTAVDNIHLDCGVPPAQIQAQVSGLPGTATIIVNEANSPFGLNVGNGLHTFENGVPSTGTGTYSVSVSAGSIPLGYACSVVNGSGTVPALATAVTTQVNCEQAQADLGGTVSSNAATQVTVTNGTGTQTISVPAGGTAGFTLNAVPTGKPYQISATASLSNTLCSASPTFGIAGTTAVSISVSCFNAPPGGAFYTIGGTVSGLPALTNISLTMNSSDVVANGQSTGPQVNGEYQFMTQVPSGSTYSIATTSPTGYTCSVQNGYGSTRTATANVIDANVICVSTGGSGGSGGTGGTGGTGGGTGGSGGTGGTGPWTVTVAVTGLVGVEAVTLQMQGPPSGGLLSPPTFSETLDFSNAGPFQFTTLVPDGSAITVNLTGSPAGKTCTVFAPSTVTSANRQVAVDCGGGSGGGGIPMLP